MDGECTGGATPDCDDSDFCTADTCVNGLGCQSSVDLSICDDFNSCTADVCDALAGCEHLLVADNTACQDSEPCTAGDFCLSGVCQPGSDEADCQDFNSCSVDSCVAGIGCAHETLADGTTCDDGLTATVGDVCKTGFCKGVADDCAQFLGLQWPTMKVTSMALGTSTDDAMDLNQDGTPDNALGPVALFINAPIAESMAAGSLIYVAHLQELSQTQAFPVHFFLGQLAPGSGGCDVQTSPGCDYEVDSSGFDEQCVPLSSFPDVTYDGETLLSSSSGLFVLTFVFGDQVFNIEMKLAQVDVPITLEESTVQSFSGKVGGAVSKAELLEIAALINAGVDLVPVIEALIEPDIDTDGDGAPESISLILFIQGLGGNIVGTYNP